MAWLRRLVVIVFGWGLMYSPLLAFAQVRSFTGPNVIYTSRGAQVVPSMFSLLKDAMGTGLTFSADGAGNVTTRQAVSVAIGTASDVAMSAARTTPASAIARGAARALPALAVGTAVWSIFDAVRCYAPPGIGTVGGMLKCDEGQPPETFDQLECSTMVGQGTGSPMLAKSRGSTPLAACQSLISQVPSNWNTGSAGPATPVGEMSCSPSIPGSCTQVYSVPFLGSQTITFGVARVVAQRCPAVPGATNPVYQVPGGPIGPDGKCPTGVGVDTSPDQAGDKVVASPLFKQNAIDALKDSAGRGIDYGPDSGPTQLSGPASANGPARTTSTTTGSGTTTTTTTPQYSITYGGDSYTFIETTITNNSDGSTTTTTSSAPEIKMCGLPGTPACKIDETGTPTYQENAEALAKITQLEQQDSDKRQQAEASVQGPDFGWFQAPPLRVCEPFEFPDGMGTLNPCGPMEMVRGIMGYVWALVGAWISVGMIRKTISGG